MINTDERWIAHHHDNRKYIQIDYQYQCGTNRTFRQTIHYFKYL